MRGRQKTHAHRGRVSMVEYAPTVLWVGDTESYKRIATSVLVEVDSRVQIVKVRTTRTTCLPTQTVIAAVETHLLCIHPTFISQRTVQDITCTRMETAGSLKPPIRSNVKTYAMPPTHAVDLH